jgi:hypothetical protein
LHRPASALSWVGFFLLAGIGLASSALTLTLAR